MASYIEFSKAFHRHFTEDPNECVRLGVEARLGDLPDPSLEANQRHAAQGRALLGQLDAVDEALDFEKKLDLDLARVTINNAIHRATYTMNGRPHAAQKPTAGHDIGEGIFTLFINDPRPAEERLANITDRIEKIPVYLGSLLERLDTPLERWRAMDVQKVAGMGGLFETLEGWAEHENWSDLGRFRKARTAATKALDAYAKALKAMETHTELHIGEEAARKTVALRGIEVPLEEIHQVATKFMARTNAQIEELRGRLVSKYGLASDASVEELQKALNVRYQVALPNNDLGAILERYREERRRLLAFIEEKSLFPIFKNQDMTILQTPGFMEPSIPAGAMMPAPPFRDGIRRSLVYLTLSHALVDEHTELSIPAMMIHEGIPGHHLQLATAGTHPSTIRKHIDAMDHAEGWTTMLEDYMLDMGYMGELTDEARFIGKRDISRLAARVGIDLFFMTGERGYLDIGVDCDLSSSDPFVAAGSLLRTVTGFVPGRVEAELNWYSQERGYPLSYLTGNHLVWNLKADITKAQKGRLEGLELDRAFHAIYLNSGNMPLTFLRRVFEHEGLLSA